MYRALFSVYSVPNLETVWVTSMSDSSRELLPVLPLRDMVVFPHGVHPLFVGTKRSIVALDSAMADDKQIFLVAKKESEKSTYRT